MELFVTSDAHRDDIVFDIFVTQMQITHVVSVVHVRVINWTMTDGALPVVECQPIHLFLRPLSCFDVIDIVNVSAVRQVRKSQSITSFPVLLKELLNVRNEFRRELFFHDTNDLIGKLLDLLKPGINGIECVLLLVVNHVLNVNHQYCPPLFLYPTGICPLWCPCSMAGSPPSSCTASAFLRSRSGRSRRRCRRCGQGGSRSNTAWSPGSALPW